MYVSQKYVKFSLHYTCSCLIDNRIILSIFEYKLDL